MVCEVEGTELVCSASADVMEEDDAAALVDEDTLKIIELVDVVLAEKMEELVVEAGAAMTTAEVVGVEEELVTTEVEPMIWEVVLMPSWVEVEAMLATALLVDGITAELELVCRMDAALGHRLSGPSPFRNATMTFSPLMPWFPQACRTGWSSAASPSTHAELHPLPEVKSEDWQPETCWVYTAWQALGRFATRGVKSESVTAMVSEGRAAAAATVALETRMLPRGWWT